MNYDSFMTCLKLINMTCLLEATCEFWLWTKKTSAKTTLTQLDLSSYQKERTNKQWKKKQMTKKILCIRSVKPILAFVISFILFSQSQPVTIKDCIIFCYGRNGSSSTCKSFRAESYIMLLHNSCPNKILMHNLKSEGLYCKPLNML